MTDMTNKPLTVRGVGSYLRREVFTLPNLITLTRIYCVYRMVAEPEETVQVFFFAFFAWVSDGLDGLIAKTFSWCSRLGATLDQWADWSLGIALIYTIFAAEQFKLNWYNMPLMWLITGYLIYRIKYWRAETTDVAKLKTFVQFVGGLVILGGHAFELDWIVIVGYIIVTYSLRLMWMSLRSYHIQGK